MIVWRWSSTQRRSSPTNASAVLWSSSRRCGEDCCRSRRCPFSRCGHALVPVGGFGSAVWVLRLEAVECTALLPRQPRRIGAGGGRFRRWRGGVAAVVVESWGEPERGLVQGSGQLPAGEAGAESGTERVQNLREQVRIAQDVHRDVVVVEVAGRGRGGGRIPVLDHGHRNGFSMVRVCRITFIPTAPARAALRALWASRRH